MKNTARIVLTLVFGWSALKGLQVLLNPSSMDLLVFQDAGVGWLFYLIPFIVTCQMISIIWFWRPFRRGHLVAGASVLLSLVETGAATIFASQNSERAKQAFIASREARGLPVREEVLTMMDDPIVQLWPLVFSFALTILWMLLIMKLKEPPAETPGASIPEWMKRIHFTSEER